MMVEPAQQSQPVRIVISAIGSMSDVMGFEAIAAGASVGCAASVAEEHEVPSAVWDTVAVGGHGLEAIDVDERGLGFADAENLSERVRPNLDPGSSERTGFSARAIALRSVNEDLRL